MNNRFDLGGDPNEDPNSGFSIRIWIQEFLKDFLDEFFGEGWTVRGSRNNRLNFDGDPDHDTDPGFLYSERDSDPRTYLKGFFNFVYGQPRMDSQE